MTKDYSLHFQDRKVGAEVETACNQTAWGLVVLKMGHKFPTLGLYSEPRHKSVTVVRYPCTCLKAGHVLKEDFAVHICSVA